MDPFYEVQKFRQPWLWVLLITVNLFMFWGLIQQLVLGQPWGSHPVSDVGLVGISLIPLLLTVLLAITRLVTTLGENGVEVAFAPFLKRQWSWSEIESAQVEAYRPLGEFGGWGLRWNGKGQAFNVRGDQGLRLQLRNGKYVVIGTQKPQEMASWLAARK